jgi:DNA-binding transcriptional LysR family regulator
VLEGQGLAQLAAFQISDLLQSGQLTTCLAQYAPDDRGHYLCYLSREHLPARVRVYIDYMTAHTRALLESSTAYIHDSAAASQRT